MGRLHRVPRWRRWFTARSIPVAVAGGAAGRSFGTDGDCERRGPIRRPVRIGDQARRGREGQRQSAAGHGGWLDRVDSSLFALPVVYFVVSNLGGYSRDRSRFRCRSWRKRRSRRRRCRQRRGLRLAGPSLPVLDQVQDVGMRSLGMLLCDRDTTGSDPLPSANLSSTILRLFVLAPECAGRIPSLARESAAERSPFRAGRRYGIVTVIEISFIRLFPAIEHVPDLGPSGCRQCTAIHPALAPLRRAARRHRRGS